MSDRMTPPDPQPVNLVRHTSEVVQQQALGAATSLVDYHSFGDCLVIAETEQALQLAARLAPLRVFVLEVSALVDDPSGGQGSAPVKRLTESGVTVLNAAPPKIGGHLGAFNVEVTDGQRQHNLALACMTQTGMFDLVLDLSPVPLIQSRLPPFGYYSGNSQQKLDKALEEMPGLVGDFDKPRYFDYNGDTCAHSRSSLPGCSRCIDICATDAISHNGEGVEVDPFLCQGCGTCATVCPTGAMTYAWPRPADAISRSRALRDKTFSTATALLLYRQSEEESVDTDFESALASSVMPLAVEEVTAFGLDYWAAMLASGFQRILVVTDGESDEPDMQALLLQADVLNRIMKGISRHPQDTFVMCVPNRAEALEQALLAVGELQQPDVSYARFATHNDKRQTLRMAIDELVSHNPSAQAMVTLPDGSPFGQVRVNADDCTLCMACVSVCPAGALLDGAEEPKLRFVEANCVQCGMCEQACPENVISRSARYLVDSTQARASVTLNEEQPFHCVRCNKAFATRKMISTMTAKLAGHWMFADKKAVHRLQMCEDCRVKDMFENEQQGIEVHRDT